MGITNGYATLQEYKDYSDITSSDSTDDAVVEDVITSASRFLDSMTNRTFYARTETRLFDVPGSRKLRLDDDLLTISTLTNGDGTVLTTSDYRLLPANVSPKYAIKLLDTSAVFWEADSSGGYEVAISVLGTWGYVATTPFDVHQACLEIAKSANGRRFGSNDDNAVKVTPAGVVISPRDIGVFASRVIAKYQEKY
jgi:hypothetical protein